MPYFKFIFVQFFVYLLVLLSLPSFLIFSNSAVLIILFNVFFFLTVSDKDLSLYLIDLMRLTTPDPCIRRVKRLIKLLEFSFGFFTTSTFVFIGDRLTYHSIHDKFISRHWASIDIPPLGSEASKWRETKCYIYFLVWFKLCEFCCVT